MDINRLFKASVASHGRQRMLKRKTKFLQASMFRWSLNDRLSSKFSTGSPCQRSQSSRTKRGHANKALLMDMNSSVTQGFWRLHDDIDRFQPVPCYRLYTSISSSRPGPSPPGVNTASATAGTRAISPSENQSNSEVGLAPVATMEEERPLDLSPDQAFLNGGLVDETKLKTLRASRVPSSRLGRLFHYGGLAAGLGWGTASEAMRRTTGIGTPCGDSESSFLLSEANVRRLVDKLTKMRGAALKLGQFMSIQDAKILPPQIEEIFAKVQNTADYMPTWQTDQVMKQELGAEWRNYFQKFSDVPLAAASIGQVHSAQVLNQTTTQETIELAVKVQFPGVYESIQSDLSYLSILAASSAILPKGLFLSSTLKVLGRELEDECDYRREAWCARMMSRFLENDHRFKVPQVMEKLSTGMVLSMELMAGTPLTRAAQWPQKLRDQLGHDILQLCLREIFHFRLMQTDPNWTNFLWNQASQQIELIDFGATREYSENFVEEYLQLLQSGVDDNREACIVWSEKIGYLTGKESDEMRNAHYRSLSALGEPFRAQVGPYQFANQTVTERVRAEVPLMVRERLTPPPMETYSLNRKLSGAFLLCSRLGSQIDCHELLQNVLTDRGKWTGPCGLRNQRVLRD